MDVKNATLVMKVGIISGREQCLYPTAPQAVVEQNGLAPGGLNFDCKVRRESTDLRDMFISHIGELSPSPVVASTALPSTSTGAMDTFARALRNVSVLIQDGVMDQCLKVCSNGAS